MKYSLNGLSSEISYPSNTPMFGLEIRVDEDRQGA
jgi:hypothetical protein